MTIQITSLRVHQKTFKFVFSPPVYILFIYYEVSRCTVIALACTRPGYVFIFSDWFPVKGFCHLDHKYIIYNLLLSYFPGKQRSGGQPNRDKEYYGHKNPRKKEC